MRKTEKPSSYLYHVNMDCEGYWAPFSPKVD